MRILKKTILTDLPSWAGQMDHKGTLPSQPSRVGQRSANQGKLSSPFALMGLGASPGVALCWATGVWPGPRACVPALALPGTHISVMVSGRLAGMAVRPLPRQSTMPLLQVHMAGQEPEERVQEGTRPASPWPAETVGCDLRRPMSAPPSQD